MSPSERVKAAYMPSRQPGPYLRRRARYTQPALSSRNRLSLMGYTKKNVPGMAQRYFNVRIEAPWP